MTSWKRKLAAYLHDPPSKCLEIRTHGERSDAAFRQAGFTDEEVGEYFAHADHTGAAADRFPFPKTQVAGLTCTFDGVRSRFRHPLDGNRQLPFPSEFRSVYQGFEGEHSIQPALDSACLNRFQDDDQRWMARFFAHWRLWPTFAAEIDWRLAFLPADTRIPDHTIWNHMQVVSALAGCVGRDRVWKPAFLKVQLGPVQEFIAASRSTRDLWSGSFLLSWLMAAGLEALSAEVGPDAVIYPNLRGQPLFDLRWRDKLWKKVRIANDGRGSVWDTLRETARNESGLGNSGNPDLDLLTPNLPNVFLAIVPADRARELGEKVHKAIEAEWEAIAESVWRKVETSGLLEFCPPPLKVGGSAKARFDAQIRRFLQIAWHALPWPDAPGEARTLATALPPARSNPDSRETNLLSRFDAVIRAATEAMPKDHRDGRFYVGGNAGPKKELNNTGVGWSLLNDLVSWGLDAVRQTREFLAWPGAGWQDTGLAASKDALTGREEMLLGGSGFAEALDRLPEKEWSCLFRHDDEVGAITLVKRVWHWTWLAERWNLHARRLEFPMPNTRDLARGAAFDNSAEENLESTSEEGRGKKYFAVLALDGDEIGKWVAGAKTPLFRTQLADYPDPDSAGTAHLGALEYFTRNSDPDLRGSTLEARFREFLDTRRLVSPSYHLQFSESLSQFALRCARRIVEAYSGRLIYAGGDDVLAMLPADHAIPCARALRAAFQGAEVPGPKQETLFSRENDGFLSRRTHQDQQGNPIPFLVPGPAADCSVGIAIAHFKNPLQDVVREALAAERRAKKDLGRSAVAVTLLKRSGETIHWGCHWNDGGLDVFTSVLDAIATGAVSRRFPHRLVGLLEGYLGESDPSQAEHLEPAPNFPTLDIIHAETLHVLDRQGLHKDLPAYRTLLAQVSESNRKDSPLHRWLSNVETEAKASLTNAQDSPARWNHLTEPERRRLKHAPVAAPLHALIGLCQTAAFIARNRTNDNP